MRNILIAGTAAVVFFGCESPRLDASSIEVVFDRVEVGSRRERAITAYGLHGDVSISVSGPFEVVREHREQGDSLRVFVAFTATRLGDHRGELLIASDDHVLRTSLMGRAIPCVPKDVCTGTELGTGACVPANDGAACEAGVIGSCRAGACTPAAPAEGTPCESPCGFEGTYGEAGCQLGARPVPIAPPVREERHGYRDWFSHASGDFFFGTSSLMGPPSEYLRVITPSGVQMPLTSGPSFQQLVVGDSLVVKHRWKTEWAVERFELSSGTRTFRLEGTIGQSGSFDSVVVEDVLIVTREDYGSQGQVTRAFEVATGAPLWTQSGRAVALESVVCLKRDSDQRQDCVEPRSGMLLFAMPYQMAPLGEDQGVLVFGGTSVAPESKLEGRSRTGELLWERQETKARAAPLAKHEGVLYFSDGERVRAQDGQLLPPIGAERWPLALIGSRAYSSQNALCAIDLGTGADEWCLPLPGSEVRSVSARSDGLRYAVHDPHKGLYVCHVAPDGGPISSFSYPTFNGYGSVAFGKDRAVVGWYPPDASGSWTLQTELLPITH